MSRYWFSDVRLSSGLAAASSAICSCFVDTSIFGSASSRLVFPFYSFLCPAPPFPTHWLPRVGSPLFWRYYEDAKTSGCSSPRVFVSFERWLPPELHFFRSPRAPGVASAAPGRWSSGLATLLRFFLFWRETVGSLKFPGYPFVLLPCSRTPVGSPRQASYGASILPPLFRLRRLQP
jgi:hypothetical protein